MQQLAPLPQPLAFPFQQVVRVEPQEAVALGLKLLFAALQLELDDIADVALELGDALQGHGAIGQ